MKKSVIFLIHLGFWLLYFLLLFIILRLAILGNGTPTNERIFQVVLTILFVPAIAVFYFFYFWLFRFYEKQKNIIRTLLFGTAFSMLTSAAGVLTLSFLIIKKLSSIQWMAVFIPELLFTFFITTIVGIIGFILRAFISWYKHKKIQEQLIRKNHEMELALVKAQLDPHFLFNTLNNIDTLIIKHPNKASNYLNKLSDILRFMLFETKNEKIKLSKEIEYINKFIDLHKIRSTNPNYIHFEVIGKLENIEIAPMVLIPFIENALKHVDDNTIDRAIKIRLAVENDIIHFLCENKSSNLKSNKEGLGNHLIQKRLDLLYPTTHKLNAGIKDGVYSVNLTIKNDEN